MMHHLSISTSAHQPRGIAVILNASLLIMTVNGRLIHHVLIEIVYLRVEKEGFLIV